MLRRVVLRGGPKFAHICENVRKTRKFSLLTNNKLSEGDTFESLRNSKRKSNLLENAGPVTAAAHDWRQLQEFGALQ